MEQVYNINQPWNSLDQWQKDYISAEGNCALLTGRQVGKSTAMSIKMAEEAIKNPNYPILVLAFTEKQAQDIFFKALNYLEAKHSYAIKRGYDKPTMHEINLKNGSTIQCYATGKFGEGIRGKTCKKVFIDEARNIAREVFVAILPMVAVTGGSIDVSSTPAGKQGFFWDIFDPKKDLNFKKFYVSGEDCPRYTKDFLESQKKTMSKLEYAQEYLAVFLDDLQRLFSDELLNKICIIKRTTEITRIKKYYLGSDIAGLGKDETTMEILSKDREDLIEQVDNIVANRNYTTQTSNKIIELDSIYNFKGIGIDDGGTGFGVFSELLNNDKTKKKVKALNNSHRPLDKDGKTKKKLLKEEMYLNLLRLMEQNKIKLLDDENLILSLKSIQFEYNITAGKQTELYISGNYSHITEGIIRALWLATQDKSLNIWCFFN